MGPVSGLGVRAGCPSPTETNAPPPHVPRHGDGPRFPTATAHAERDPPSPVPGFPGPADTTRGPPGRHASRRQASPPFALPSGQSQLRGMCLGGAVHLPREVAQPLGAVPVAAAGPSSGQSPGPGGQVGTGTCKGVLSSQNHTLGTRQAPVGPVPPGRSSLPDHGPG